MTRPSTPRTSPQKRAHSPQKKLSSPQKNSPQKKPPPTPNNPQLLATPQVNPLSTPQHTRVSECKHTCKDKSKCKHECCKGLKAKYKRKHDDGNPPYTHCSLLTHTQDDVINLTGRDDANPASANNDSNGTSANKPNPGNNNKRSKIVPLTHFFKPLVPQLEPKNQEQVVPNVDVPTETSADLTLDPNWFDDPFALVNSLSHLLSISHISKGYCRPTASESSDSK
jgi:hypothetical protein